MEAPSITRLLPPAMHFRRAKRGLLRFLHSKPPPKSLNLASGTEKLRQSRLGWYRGIRSHARACTPCAAATLYYGDIRHSDHADGCARRIPHAGRYFPQHRHPGRLRRLELSRPIRRRHGTPRRPCQRAFLFNDRQWHREDGIAFHSGPRHHQGVFRARHGYRRGHSSDFRPEQFSPAHHPAGHDPAQYPSVQRLERSGRAGDAGEQDAARATDLRLWPELPPPQAVHYSRTVRDAALRR